MANVYPQSLLDVAPADGGERSKAVQWFMRNGFGEGAAKNKAATYFRIGSSTPSDSSSTKPRKREKTSIVSGNESKSSPEMDYGRSQSTNQTAASSRRLPDMMPLNVNVQIHISADAGTEQITSIFAAMRQYLYAGQDS